MGGYYHKAIQNAEIRRPMDTGAMRRLVMAVSFGILLIGGFAFSIWQHVEAVTFGYRTERLRQERQQLEEKKRKLELERAYQSSPEVVEKAARDLGLVGPDSSQVVVANKTRTGKGRARLPKAVKSRP